MSLGSALYPGAWEHLHPGFWSYLETGSHILTRLDSSLEIPRSFWGWPPGIPPLSARNGMKQATWISLSYIIFFLDV